MEKFKINDSNIEHSNVNVTDISISVGILGALLGLIVGFLLSRKFKITEEPVPVIAAYDPEDDLDFSEIDQRLSDAL